MAPRVAAQHVAPVTLAGGFAKRGHRVDLVVVEAEGPLAGNLPEGVQLVVLDSPLLRLVNRIKKRKRRLRINASGFALARYLWQERPDVLLSAANHVHLTAVIAARLSFAPVRVVLRVSNHLTGSHLGDSERQRPVRLKFARRVYGWADAAIAVSQGIAYDLVEHTRLSREQVCAVTNPTYTPEIESAATATLDHPWVAPVPHRCCSQPGGWYLQRISRPCYVHLHVSVRADRCTW